MLKGKKFTKKPNHRIADHFSAMWVDSRSNMFDLADIAQRLSYYYVHPMNLGSFAAGDAVVVVGMTVAIAAVDVVW